MSTTTARPTISALEESLWALTAFVHLAGRGVLGDRSRPPTSADERGAADVVTAAGVAVWNPDGTLAITNESANGVAGVREATMSTFRQVAQIVGITDTSDTSDADVTTTWAANDDASLLAQGRASARGGEMLAHVATAVLPGLTESFAGGGHFLDVGTGVGELGAAFARLRPAAHVVGIDVLPRALDIARRLNGERGLVDRFELRLQSVTDIDDVHRFDLAWLPAPFIPAEAFRSGLRRIATALRPGGWIVVGAGRFDEESLAVAVTRWRTIRDGGTPLPRADAEAALGAAGFVQFLEVPTPHGGPAIYAARTPS